MTNTIEIENLNISDLDIPTDETLQEVVTSCEGIATSCEGVATSCDSIATSCDSVVISCDSIATSCGDLAKDTTLQATNTALGSLATDTTLQNVKGSIDSVASAEGTLNTTLGAVAKDATLQATNTALGGLNTSVGAIIKDTTGQSIDASVGNIATVLSDVATDNTLAGVAKDTTLQATNTALGSLMADTTGQSIASAISGLGATLGSDRALIDGSNIVNPSVFKTNIGLNTQSYNLINPVTQVYYSSLKRKDNMVLLYVEMYNFASQTLTTIATLPTDCIPSHRQMFDCIVLNANGDEFKGVARGAVNTNGTITYQNLGNYAATFASFTVVYFI